MELLHSLLKEARNAKASDVHISVNEQVSLRINGELNKTKLLVTGTQVKQMVESLLNIEQHGLLAESGEIDSAYLDNDRKPYRVNISKCDDRYNIVIRIISVIVPSSDELLLPEVVKTFTNLKQGLILVCGSTGCGKSTTLASLIDKMNNESKLHIITLEDPIEYRYTNKMALIHQREVGRDTKSFLTGLRNALRQDPDVILVGELRDKETMAAALTAAETGHLVLATLHTADATGAINRILDSFDEGRELIRSQLADVLHGIVCQELLMKKDRSGRVANFEVLIVTPALRSLIREGRTHQIASYIHTGKPYGMLTKEEHKKILVNKGLI